MMKVTALTVALNLINDSINALTEDDLPEYRSELLAAKFEIDRMISVAKKEEQRNQVKRRARKIALAPTIETLREILSHTQLGMTVRDIYSDFVSKKGESLSQGQIQYILLNDMFDEVESIDNGRNPKTYRLRGE